MKNMTKPGYTHIIVPQSLHDQLKNLAQENSLSISQLISQLVSININVNVSINTAITQLTALKHNLPQALNQEQTPNQAPNNAFSLSEGSLSEKRKFLVRSPGFEPGSSAWEADVLAKLDYDRYCHSNI